MGVICNSPRKKLDIEQILANINKFFEGMFIRSSDIKKIMPEIRDSIYYKNEENIKFWEKFLNEELNNSEFGQTTKAFVTSAVEEAKTNYNDPNLPLLCLLFLANSDKNKFLSSFIEVNEVLREEDVDCQIKVKTNNDFNSLFPPGGSVFAISTRENNIKNFVRINNLKNLMSYYINYTTFS